MTIREPEPSDAGRHLFLPDFALHPRFDPGRRWFMEIVGFWTPEYLASKLRAAAARPRVEPHASTRSGTWETASCLRALRWSPNRGLVDAAKALEIVR